MDADPAPLTRPQRLALTTASFLLLVIASMALGPLLAGSGWWWLCAFIAAGTLYSGFGLRAVRTPPSLVPVLELGVLLLLLTLFFGGGSSIALIVPTQGTFETFGELFDGAQRTIEQQSVPAITVPPLLFALALGIGVLAVVTDILVQTVRMPALAAAPALVPILIPGFLIEAGAELPTLVLTAAAYLLLLRVDVRVRRRARLTADDDPAGRETGQAATVIAPKRVPIVSTLGASLGLAAVGLLAASVLAASTPSISTSLLLGSPTQGTLFARGVSPFIDLGRDLRRPEPRAAFHYLARDGDRPYFTLLSLDRFEGEVWGATERAVDGDNTVEAMPRPDGLSRRVQTSEHPIDVVIDEVRTTWLPVPYPTAAIEGLEGSWFWEDGSLTVRSVDSDTDGQRYRVTRLEVEPTPAQLRAADDVPPQLAPYLALPEELPAIITDTAASITAGMPSRYDAAVAIQAYLRGVDFDYSTEAPVEEGYDGGGFDVIAKFLETKAGYCVHFASTMAVLAREAGIPARISIGYTQGSPTEDRIDGVQRVEVDSHDLHSWPELYFEGVGWVPFEPTPGRGTVPDYSRPNAGEEQGPNVPNAATSTPGASGRPDLDPDRGLAGGSGNALGAAGDLWLRGGAVLLVVFVLLLTPAALRASQRLTRSGRIRRGERPADAAWDELVATSRDLGAGGGEAETARAFASRIGGRPAFEGDASARSALLRLRDAVERERYGPAGRSPGPGIAEDLVTTRAALRADASATERARALLVPRSLFERARRMFGDRLAPGA